MPTATHDQDATPSTHLVNSQNINSKARTPQPSLPIEIWALVLEHIANDTDFPETWAACSLVSHALSKAADLAFRRESLRNLDMALSLIGCIGRNQEKVHLQFKRLSQDGQRVFYGRSGDAPADPQQQGRGTYLSEGIMKQYLQNKVPILVEWVDKIYFSVYRGPKGYIDWSEQDRQHSRPQLWLAPNIDSPLRLAVHYTEPYEVSFLWKSLLRLFLRRPPLASMTGASAEESHNTA